MAKSKLSGHGFESKVFQNHLFCFIFFFFVLIQKKSVVHCKLFQYICYILLYLYLYALPIHSLLLFDPTSLQTVPISASTTFIRRHMQITIHFLHSLALDFILSHTITLPLPLPLSLTASCNPGWPQTLYNLSLYFHDLHACKHKHIFNSRLHM